MGRTMAWLIEGRLNVVVHGPKSPTNLEWTRYLADLRVLKGTDFRVIVFSHGVGPDGAQRRQLTATFDNELKVPVALLTESILVRGIVGALRWFNPRFRAFGLNEMTAACSHLELNADERDRVRAIRTELEIEVVAPEAARPTPP
jgi:hypothetical protein